MQNNNENNQHLLPIKSSDYRWAYFLLAVTLFIFGSGAVFLFAPLALIPVFFVASYAIKTAVAWLGVLLIELAIGVFFRKVLEKTALQVGLMMVLGLVANFFFFAVVLPILAAELSKFVLGYVIVVMVTTAIYINAHVSNWRAKKAADEAANQPLDGEKSQDTPKNEEKIENNKYEESKNSITEKLTNQLVTVTWTYYYNKEQPLSGKKRVASEVIVEERHSGSSNFTKVPVCVDEINFEQYKNNSEFKLLKLEFNGKELYYKVQSSCYVYISRAEIATPPPPLGKPPAPPEVVSSTSIVRRNVFTGAKTQEDIQQGGEATQISVSPPNQAHT